LNNKLVQSSRRPDATNTAQQGRHTAAMRPFAKLLCPLVVIIARTRKRLVSNAAEVAAHVEVEHLVVLESLREVAGHKHVGDARPLYGRRLQRRRAVHRRSWTVRRRYLHGTYIDR